MDNKNACKLATTGTIKLFINPTPKGTIVEPTKLYSRPSCDEFYIRRSSDKRLRYSREIERSVIHFSNYRNLFDRLIEDKRQFFTEEYGKNQQDYQKYILNKTDIYDNENPSSYKLESKLNIKEIMSETFRVQRSSFFSTKTVKKSRRKMNRGESKLSIWRNSLPAKLPSTVKPLKPFEYKLSDPEMLKRGITVDTQITARPIKLFIFHSMLSNPVISGLLPSTPIKQPTKLFYPNCALCAVSTLDGRTFVYNRNRTKSIAFLPGIVGNFFVVYSPKRRNFNNQLEPFPLAMFDLNGNGVVYDENGKKRLIYDQAQGIWFDSPVKMPIKWRWQAYDTIIRRRDEMKFVKPDEILDIDHEEKLRQRAKRELVSKPFRKRKKKLTVFESDTVIEMGSGRKKHTPRSVAPEGREGTDKRKIPTEHNLLSNQGQKVDKDFLCQLFGKTKYDLKNLSTPVKLKLTRSKCSIEPLLQLCESALRMNEPQVSVKDLGERKDTISTRKVKSKVKDHGRINFKDLLFKCYPNTLSPPLAGSEAVTAIKPIVMKISDTVSLTILTQDHIHIDFYSYPFHFQFEIGIIPNSNYLKRLYSVKNTQEVKEPIPCFFEVMQEKSVEFKSIGLKLKQMRDEARVRLDQSQLNFLRTWGYNVFL